MATPKKKPSQKKTGRSTGKTVGRPACDGTQANSSEFTNESSRLKPRPKELDFEVPPTFAQDSASEIDSNPNLARQVDKLQADIERMNDDYHLFASDHYRTELTPGALPPSGSTWNSTITRSLPMKLLAIEAASQLGYAVSMNPKVKVVYDANGKVKSKEVSNSTPSVQYLSLWMSCLELQHKLATSLKPSNETKMTLNIPENGDRRKYMLVEILKECRLKMGGGGGDEESVDGENSAEEG